MSWIESIQKAIDYIENHLLDVDLSIEQVAKACNSSAFHFQRTFSILMDSTIGDYIRRRRLTLAAQDLVTTNDKIIDIAYKYGYETPESFAKAFRKQHNLSPSEARKKSGSLQAYNRLVIKISLEGALPMNYKIIEKEAFQVVGVKRTYSYKNGENLKGIPQFWHDVHADGTNDRLFDLNDGDVEGVLGVCVVEESRKDEGLMEYWIAAAHKGKAPDGMGAYEIPASKWVIFEVHGAMPHAMQDTWKKIYSEWFPSNPYKPAGTAELEVYTNGDSTKADYYSEIWIPIK